MATTSFTADIRPLFRDRPDIEAMRGYGLDLSSYEGVKSQASQILARLEDGSMPCDGPWSRERIDLFRRWIREGMAP